MRVVHCCSKSADVDVLKQNHQTWRDSHVTSQAEVIHKGPGMQKKQTSKMIRVAHIPNRLQRPRAASTDSPTISTPVSPTPTRLHNTNHQDTACKHDMHRDGM